jgi:hypothetical protein
VKPAAVIPVNPNNAGLPTTEQLTMIAATLAGSAHTSDFGAFVPSLFTQRAMKLWLAAHDTISWADYEDEIGRQERNHQDFKDAIYLHFQRSDKYPVTRDEFLKKMLPHLTSRAHELTQIGKAYWRRTLFEKNFIENGQKLMDLKEPTQNEINDAFANWGPFQDHHTASIMFME